MMTTAIAPLLVHAGTSGRRKYQKRLIKPGPTKPFRKLPARVLSIGASGTGVFERAAPICLKYGAGPARRHPAIEPIFRDGEWVAPSSQIALATILKRIQQIIDRPYLKGLALYGFNDGWLLPRSQRKISRLADG